ncbi:HesA/MoeB/ThiF family protein [Neolewinella antarctica]|uniref:Adenylyltransferase/sulfurtransferase n=1 Tax=Neolewinella antarctica TaxID=442734 RepID=A0ABX0X7J1_9BACT|nr:HesA/MoeB/ThiF family protein [Neolewinella antarctica]NJC24966.1 adenylyltransferase/sulfurtransferase [Neolewinella antarctica]
MSPEDRNRYARQIVLPGVGEAGQAKLSATSVLIVGCGGLGNPAAVYLTGAGIGELTLVDGDKPTVSNLHRQVFFREGETDTKADALATHCRSLNPGTRVRAVNEYLEVGNVKALVQAADIVLDCTDDAVTKHLLSDACHLLRKPLVYAAAQVFEGYLALFPNDTAKSIHLRDLFPEPDPTLPDCATTGVLNTAVGTIGMLQANAALTFLLGIGTPPIDTLLTYNLLDNRQHRLKIKKQYDKVILPPWGVGGEKRASLETDDFELARYDLVFTMLDEQREPEPAADVIRLTKRNPYGQCVERMTPEGEYLIYCNSGKLSLMLASQLQKAGFAALSLRGGLVAFGR